MGSPLCVVGSAAARGPGRRSRRRAAEAMRHRRRSAPARKSATDTIEHPGATRTNCGERSTLVIASSPKVVRDTGRPGSRGPCRPLEQCRLGSTSGDRSTLCGGASRHRGRRSCAWSGPGSIMPAACARPPSPTSPDRRRRRPRGSRRGWTAWTASTHSTLRNRRSRRSSTEGTSSTVQGSARSTHRATMIPRSRPAHDRASWATSTRRWGSRASSATAGAGARGPTGLSAASPWAASAAMSTVVSAPTKRAPMSYVGRRCAATASSGPMPSWKEGAPRAP